MASVAAAAAIRRIPPPRIYVSTIAASINRRRSTTETKQPTVYENDQDHEKCFIQENELRELNRRHLIRIELLENDYRQLDDDMAQLQHEHNALLKQKRMLEEELERSSYHATSNVDLHVYTQRLENECRDLRSQITLREKEKFELNEMIADLEVQMKQARERQEEWRDAYNELENTLAIETVYRGNSLIKHFILFCFLGNTSMSGEQQQCHQAELDDFFRLVDKRLLSESEESSNQQHRLVSILEAYEHELNRLRQTTRTNDDTIRSYERRLAEQQSMASNWRMKNTFLEKNQRKLIDKIKELNSERRQLIESSAQKRTRRRAQPTNQIEQKQEKPPVILPPPSQPEIRTYHLTRSRSLPSLKSSNNGRQSRNDSGVVLNDEIFNHQSQSIIHNRRRIKTNTINQLVMHTSNHDISKSKMRCLIEHIHTYTHSFRRLNEKRNTDAQQEKEEEK
ncbi:unnamed protein product [Rotaria socialis]|uniref:Uncharacterized protein n=1 Tax=Rotaria socialis TaxID=392032 RepID=A0A820WN85_9BILA|nr:unnamed protein product [Rotaria socialis]